MQDTIDAITQNKTQKWLYILFTISGISWMLYLMFNSPGYFFLDEIAHVNLARFVWFDNSLLWDWWGRIGYTILYVIPVLGGIEGARLFSVVLTFLILTLLTAICHKLGVKRLYLVPLTFLFQPWVLTLYFSANTMIPFAFFMMLGTYFWLNEQLNLASLSFGMMTLCRHEGIALMGLWLLYLLYHRHWRASLVSWIPIIAYNLTYMPVMGVGFMSIPFMSYFTPKPTDFYGSGTWFTFINFTVWSMGITTFFWWLHGIFVTKLRSREGLIIFFYLSFLALHTIIFRFGLFASGGYGFFVMPIAPVLAITALRGIEYAIERFETNLEDRSILLASLIVIFIFLPIIINSMMFVGFRQLDPTSSATEDAAIWLEDNNVNKENVVMFHPHFYYIYFFGSDDLSPTPQSRDLLNLPIGTYLVWDAHFSNRTELDLEYLEDTDNPWQEVANFENAIIFYKISD